MTKQQLEDSIKYCERRLKREAAEEYDIIRKCKICGWLVVPGILALSTLGSYLYGL